jgi:hypothetical protein
MRADEKNETGVARAGGVPKVAGQEIFSAAQNGGNGRKKAGRLGEIRPKSQPPAWAKPITAATGLANGLQVAEAVASGLLTAGSRGRGVKLAVCPKVEKT